MCLTVQDAEERSFTLMPISFPTGKLTPSCHHLADTFLSLTRLGGESLVKHISREPVSLQSGQSLIIQRKFSMSKVFRRFWKTPDCSLL